MGTEVLFLANSPAVVQVSTTFRGGWSPLCRVTNRLNSGGRVSIGGPAEYL